MSTNGNGSRGPVILDANGVDATPRIIEDGWTNLLSSLGTGGDPRQRTSFRRSHGIPQQELEEIYRADGIGRKVVDLPAQEMVREWIEVEGDTDGLILKELTRIKARPSVRAGIQWARLYGGAIVVVLVDDGQKLDKPLRPDAVRRVLGLRVYDRWQVWWTTRDLQDNGEPKVYTVTPYTAGAGGQFQVHHSRVLRFEGEALPPRVKVQNQGWGDSVLQGVYDRLRDLGIAWGASANIVNSFIQHVLSIEGLQDMIAAGQEKHVKKRLELIDLSRSVLNTVLLDSREQYVKNASSVAGLADLLDRIAYAVCADTGIPATRLFGRSPDGMNATGESDQTNWYDELASEQEDVLREPLQRLVDLIARSKDGPFRGKPPEDELVVEFRPLWQLSDDKQADVRSKMALADRVYMEMGAVDPAEIAQSRFGGKHFSLDTELDTETLEQRLAPLAPQEGDDPEGAPAPKAPGAEEPATKVPTPSSGQDDTEKSIDADHALNGAQITAAIDVLKSLRAPQQGDRISKVSAIELLVAVGIERDKAVLMVDSSPEEGGSEAPEPPPGGPPTPPMPPPVEEEV